MEVNVRPIKISFTFPRWAERDEPLLIDEVHGLEISELHVDCPLSTFEHPFEMEDDKAVNYPYLKVCCISETIAPLGDYWLKKSVHIPML